MMKGCYLLCIFLIFGTLLFAANPYDAGTSNVQIKITEFGYPFIPNASQLKIQYPMHLNYGTDKTIKFELNTWYRAISPYFLPDIFYEVGVGTSINLLKKGRSSLLIGIGTSFSQSGKNISIPFILPLEYRYAPFEFLELDILLQNMVYGEGFISELLLATELTPFSSGISIDIGGSANLAYSWAEDIFEYSYGLLFGLGCQF
ncbi:MAG: hypothetical protein A2Y31_12840 [Spirochaetes bacterium GWC2_52_13]|nr:MAG: hypothetical protein A2Y31_12840 [Spirochaetes bacterium GWC2_52_13]HCG62549.1 hypothetical protein [Sphaerochaeta sp.]